MPEKNLEKEQSMYEKTSRRLGVKRQELEQKEVTLEEFQKSGGKILELYPNENPKIWKCGRGKGGELVDPPGMKGKAIYYINTQGEWEAGNPDQKLSEEIKLWRSDWVG